MVRPIPHGTQMKSTTNRVSAHLHMPIDLFHSATDKLLEERKRRPKLSWSAFVCERLAKGLKNEHL